MLRVALILAALAGPVSAEMRCERRDLLAAWLVHEHGLALHSWGLTDSGEMVELFLGPKGHWAVIATAPNRCAVIRDMPHKLRGRLAPQRRPHMGAPEPRRLHEGEAM